MSTPNVLERIVADKRIEVESRKANMPLYAIEPGLQKATRSFYNALKKDKQNNGASFILEVKKASPSKGLIRTHFDLDEICQAYRQYASCVSVLTDEKYFQGDFERLPKVRELLPQPILCKDFFISEYQVYLARFYGADAILLMLSVLDDETYESLAKVAQQYDMDILTEVSNEEEMHRAVKLQANIIGINNRNLRDLSTDLNQTPKLVELYESLVEPKFRENTLIISESGIYTHQHVAQLSSIADGFLVGSSLMAEPNLNLACQSLVVGKTKVCGITRAEDLVTLAKNNIEYAGLINVVGSPRFIDMNKAVSVIQEASQLLNNDVAIQGQACVTPRMPKLVLVTRDQQINDLVKNVSSLGVAAIQLHGNEDTQYIEELHSKLQKLNCHIEIWKAIGIRAFGNDSSHNDTTDQNKVGIELEAAIDALPKEIISKIVLDTKSTNGQSGGTGTTFDWNVLASLSYRFDIPEIILAGGLSPENIVSARQQLTSGFDLNSGVEDSAGKKSATKIKQISNFLFGPYEA